MATLLELVCEHVKVWPDGVLAITQSVSGRIYHVYADDDASYESATRMVLLTADDRELGQVTKEQWLGYKMVHPDVQIAITSTPKFAPCPEMDAVFEANTRGPACEELAKTTSVQCNRDTPISRKDIENDLQMRQSIGRALRPVVCDVDQLTKGFQLPPTGKQMRCDTNPLSIGMIELHDGAQAHIPRTEYELLLASRQAWLQVMQALDETHPDWATGTTRGTLVERAIKAIKNEH